MTTPVGMPRWQVGRARPVRRWPCPVPRADPGPEPVRECGAPGPRRVGVGGAPRTEEQAGLVPGHLDGHASVLRGERCTGCRADERPRSRSTDRAISRSTGSAGVSRVVSASSTMTTRRGASSRAAATSAMSSGRTRHATPGAPRRLVQRARSLGDDGDAAPGVQQRLRDRAPCGGLAGPGRPRDEPSGGRPTRRRGRGGASRSPPPRPRRRQCRGGPAAARGSLRSSSSGSDSTRRGSSSGRGSRRQEDSRPPEPPDAPAARAARAAPTAPRHIASGARPADLDLRAIGREHGPTGRPVSRQAAGPEPGEDGVRPGRRDAARPLGEQGEARPRSSPGRRWPSAGARPRDRRAAAQQLVGQRPVVHGIGRRADSLPAVQQAASAPAPVLCRRPATRPRSIPPFRHQSLPPGDLLAQEPDQPPQPGQVTVLDHCPGMGQTLEGAVRHRRHGSQVDLGGTQRRAAVAAASRSRRSSPSRPSPLLPSAPASGDPDEGVLSLRGGAVGEAHGEVPPTAARARRQVLRRRCRAGAGATVTAGVTRDGAAACCRAATIRCRSVDDPALGAASGRGAGETASRAASRRSRARWPGRRDPCALEHLDGATTTARQARPVRSLGCAASGSR